jgi:hypothetical protein
LKSEEKIMMPKEKFIEAVGERDIDLLLLEEFHVSAQFQKWFAAKALGTERHGCRFQAASHAVSDPMLGESDLIAYYADPQGQVLAILIEDKIDAAAQPEQAARYLKRGEAGILAGRWNSFRTCIVGPRNYLESAPDAAGYQVSITYEEVCEFPGQQRQAIYLPQAPGGRGDRAEPKRIPARRSSRGSSVLAALLGAGQDRVH